MSEYLSADKKQEIFGKYGKSNVDTGSPESQVALFSYRIAHLTEHLKNNKKDHNTQRALLRLVGKRRQLLDYLKSKDIERYFAVCSALGYGIALILFSGMREQLEMNDVPKTFRGVPIALITAGIMAMAFMGFSGLV